MMKSIKSILIGIVLIFLISPFLFPGIEYYKKDLILSKSYGDILSITRLLSFIIILPLYLFPSFIIDKWVSIFYDQQCMDRQGLKYCPWELVRIEAIDEKMEKFLYLLKD